MSRKSKHLPIIWRGLLFLLLLLALLFQLLRILTRRKKMTTKSNKVEQLRAALIKAGFKKETAALIVAQAAHESANFTSVLYTEYNNPFGMKQPLVRKTTSKATFRGYAVFESIEAAAVDMLLWFKARKMPLTFTSTENYIDVLITKQYFEAGKAEYLNGVNYFYNLYKNEV